MLSLLYSKVITAAALMIANTIAAFLSYFTVEFCSLKQSSRSSDKIHTFLSFANCFSVGIFLSVCFLGLHNSATMKIIYYQQTVNMSIMKSYPISEFLLCSFLFVVWFFEGTVSMCLQPKFNRCTNKQSVSHYHHCSNNVKRNRPDADNKSSQNEDDDEVVLLADVVPRDSYAVASTANEVLPSFRSKDQLSNTRDATTFLKTIMLTSALGLHSVMEGIGFGLLDSIEQVFGMAVAMALHQVLCSATLAVRLATTKRCRAEKCGTVVLLVFYLLLVPIGTTIGTTAHWYSESSAIRLDSGNHSSNSTLGSGAVSSGAGVVMVAALQNLAAATFLYVIFIDMLPSEISNATRADSSGLPRCLVALLGFTVIAALRLVQSSHTQSASNSCTQIVPRH